MTDAPDAAPVSRKEHPLQDALARWLGVPVEGRAAIVREMFTRHREDAVSYWLQIVLATGIATLGLVLSSTGIVIGAMLISPLMSPIVGLGMGLAVGAPLLTLRSMFRVAASIVWVMGLAALLTVGLPFHETTNEIAARTSPTVLDLVVAAFCALAAGFTTARQSVDTTSTAAGTAIGISLVPPLCVAGYGFGVGQWAITGGALLLFTANFCAIIFCSALLFVALGFNHVSLDEGVEVGLGARLARRLRAIFGTRYGVMWRLVLPTLLLASVYVPLRAALGEVAWKIQVRDQITRILRELAPDGRSVRTSMAIDPTAVRVQVALIGSPEEARDVEVKLRVQIAAASGLDPEVDVTAVPDDRALQRIAESVAAPRPAALPLAPPPVRPSNLHRSIGDVLAAHWPAASGSIERWRLEFDAQGNATLDIRHVGPPLGSAAESLLGDFVRLAVGEAVTVRAEPVLIGEWRAGAQLTTEFVEHLARGLAAVQGSSSLRACVTRTTSQGPADATVGREPKETAESGLASTARRPFDAREVPGPEELPESNLVRAADLLIASLAGPRVEVRDGAAWSLNLVTGACPPAPAPTPPDLPEAPSP